MCCMQGYITAGGLNGKSQLHNVIFDLHIIGVQTYII